MRPIAQTGLSGWRRFVISARRDITRGHAPSMCSEVGIWLRHRNVCVEYCHSTLRLYFTFPTVFGRWQWIELVAERLVSMMVRTVINVPPRDG